MAADSQGHTVHTLQKFPSRHTPLNPSPKKRKDKKRPENRKKKKKKTGSGGVAHIQYHQSPFQPPKAGGPPAQILFPLQQLRIHRVRFFQQLLMPAAVTEIPC